MTREKLESLTVTALRAQAREAGIPGRSRMRKRALVEALFEALSKLSVSSASEAPAPVSAPADAVIAPVPEEAVADVVPSSALQELVAGDAVAEAPSKVEAVVPTETGPETSPLPTAPELQEDRAEATPSAPEQTPEPAPPETVFIDRGAVLPAGYGDAVVRVMIRDPGTAFVYWEPDPGHQPRSWEVQAWARDRLLSSFQVEGAAREGYLHVPTRELHRVVVVSTEGAAMVASSPVPEPPPARDEVWVTLQPAAFEAPASAPFHGTPARASKTSAARWPDAEWIVHAAESGDDSPVAAYISRPPSAGQDMAASAPISAYTTPR